ncbi:succinylglutamate desuccinylase/aspartoacylase domain-containing protein [Nitrospirillum sp. BR 11828]|uniref:succinylglutamate desuccinylase/aspartoacylase domain-containing protein n=1 Tax=Nitrospirillum sp. BR 11828 TaxID=3104325 RepID=UPI002ACA7F11|nr:succinylglutamate desuccinylase/aspartoacylase family protein [Nitrospirillum sp. BR 11828]MDZ5646049.1 succinylglutamate desuccinylase/aspartoacylase family protein [Nitrospirillum sp. BR 11828]
MMWDRLGPPLGPATPQPPLAMPDLRAHRAGNIGVPYVWRFEGKAEGPHVAIVALMHGNEPCGAVALDRLLRRGLRPTRGTWTLAFANTDAAAGGRLFGPAGTPARYLDQDMNRLWAGARASGPPPGHTHGREQARVAALAPLILTADLLLDLHSMQVPSPALTLCGRSPRGRALAVRLADPGWVVADDGHADGRRLIDHPRFTGPGAEATAILMECGQHASPAAGAQAWRGLIRFLALSETLDAATVRTLLGEINAPAIPPRPTVVDVTHAIQAQTDEFAFVRPFQGLERIAAAGTLLALDGKQAIHTPYDDCVLVMPTRSARRGQTTVRLGRIL